MKILYVEENELHRTLTENHLTQNNHQVDNYLPAESIFSKDGILSF